MTTIEFYNCIRKYDNRRIIDVFIYEMFVAISDELDYCNDDQRGNFMRHKWNLISRVVLDKININYKYTVSIVRFMMNLVHHITGYFSEYLHCLERMLQNMNYDNIDLLCDMIIEIIEEITSISINYEDICPHLDILKLVMENVDKRYWINEIEPSV